MLGFSIGFLITGILFNAQSLDERSPTKCIVYTVAGILCMLLSVAMFIIRNYI